MNKTIFTLSSAIALGLSTPISMAEDGMNYGQIAEDGNKSARQQARIEKRVATQMARFDVNQDGEITLDEVQFVRETRFAEMDADSSGGVSLEEFKDAAKAARAAKKQQRLENAFNEADANDDGNLSLEEFMASKEKRQRPESEADEQDSADEGTRRGQRPNGKGQMAGKNKGGKQAGLNGQRNGPSQPRPESEAGEQDSADEGAQRGQRQNGEKGKQQAGLNGQCKGPSKNNKGKRKNNGKQLKAKFNRLDNDKDGEVSLEEFKRNVPFFNKFDMNDDGVITVEELSQKPSRQ